MMHFVFTKINQIYTSTYKVKINELYATIKSYYTTRGNNKQEKSILKFTEQMFIYK
jgi:hypothetical protein